MNVKKTIQDLIQKVPQEKLTKADEKAVNVTNEMMTFLVTSTVAYLEKTKIITTLRDNLVLKLTKKISD